jgi:6-phosphogluconolactonase
MSGDRAHSNGSTPVEGEPLLDVLPDAEAATAAASTLIASALAEAVRQRGRADWATTGGSTPIPIYRRLVQPPLRDLVPWDRVHVWWGDDRAVPRDHPLSNRLPFDEIVLHGEGEIDSRTGAEPGAPLPLANVHAMPIEASRSLAASAAAYAAELRAAPLDRDGAGFPILDVVLVGVGPDGHVFSVFPDSALFDAADWVSTVPAPEHVEPHVARISLHPRILVAARLPVVVILGASKAGIVANVLGGKRDPRCWPAQLARRAGAAWFLDAAAAAELPGASPRA